MEVCLENLYVDIGKKRVKLEFQPKISNFGSLRWAPENFLVLDGSQVL